VWPGNAIRLTQLVAAAREHTPDALERLLVEAVGGDVPPQSARGTEYLVFTCGTVECALPLTALREVLPALPDVVPLPFSPDWLLGIFPFRLELLALVDPMSLLLERPDEAAAPPRMTVIVGDEKRSLGWAVTAVGDIARVRDEELRAVVAEMPEGLPLRPQYIEGVYTPSEGESRYFVLRADAVMDELLRGLEESDERDVD
jgi:purine-binding chemotaxis protein CheW